MGAQKFSIIIYKQKSKVFKSSFLFINSSSYGFKVKMEENKNCLDKIDDQKSENCLKNLL